MSFLESSSRYVSLVFQLHISLVKQKWNCTLGNDQNVMHTKYKVSKMEMYLYVFLMHTKRNSKYIIVVHYREYCTFMCLRRSCFSRSESTQDKEPTKAATVFQMTISLWVPPLLPWKQSRKSSSLVENFLSHIQHSTSNFAIFLEYKNIVFSINM